MTKKELQDKKNKLAHQIREMAKKFNDAGKKWADQAERDAWQKLNDDYDAASRELQTLIEAESVDQRLGDLETEERQSQNSGNPLPGQEDTRHQRDRGGNQDRESDEEIRARAFSAFFRSNLGMGLDENDLAAMRQCRMFPGQRELAITLYPTQVVRSWGAQFRGGHASRVIADLMDSRTQRRDIEQRALNTYTMGSGGALVPGSFVRSLEVNMLAYGGVRQVAETIVTADGGEMAWPVADDTGNEATIVGELQEGTTDTDPSFEAQKWRAYKFKSGSILVSSEILRDAFLDLPSLLGDMLGERLGRGTNRKHTLGTGNGQPNGIVPRATVGRTTAAQAITFEDVMRLEHSVDPAYRNGAGFMCHDSILLALKLLQDGEGRYLWQSGIDIGQPDRLDRRPLTINQHMESTTAGGEDVLLFGQLSKHKIRRVRTLRLYRLEERYREDDKDAFLAFLEEDSDTLNAGTAPIKKLRIAAA